MCGRFVAATDPEGLVRFLVVDERRAELPASYNVAPTQDVYAAVEHERRRYLVAFRWGLVPRWATDLKVGPRMINARVETLAQRPAYRDALERRRCLVPADGFYEWRDAGGRRQPHFVRRPDGTPLAFAGLWSTWHPPGDGTPIRTCTIVTRPATSDVEPLHDRMPAILGRDAWDAWLDPDTRGRDAVELLAAAQPPPLVFSPVNGAVNDHRRNGPQLLEPAGAPVS